MSNGFSVINVKSGVRDHSKVSDFASLQTTLGFGQLCPIFATELLPGDKFNVQAEIFSRCAPLVVPTYGKAEIKTASFFIPYFQVAKDADAFFSGNTTFRATTVRHRFMTMEDLFNFFNFAEVSETVTLSATVTHYDWKYKNASGTIIYKKFTQLGKFWYKCLRNLGYQIPAGIDLGSSSNWTTTQRLIHVSAYPVLAFFKAYNDWMMQSQYFNVASLTNLLYNIKLGINVSSKYNNGQLLSSGLLDMFKSLYVLYQNDYFTSSWRFPNSPLGQDTTVTSVGFIHTDSDSKTVQRNNNNVYVQNYSSGYQSQRALDFLRRFDDWVRRNNYAGSRDVQQIYSRFGIKTDDFKSHYAYLLDRSTFPLQVGDVTSTAETEDGELGSYAGKGIITSECKTEFESSDYGLLLVVAWIAVKPIYADGFDRMVLRSDPFDYFNPEFDALGPQAISVMELTENNKDFDYSSSLTSQSVYGFTEKYNDYRTFRSKVSGDFITLENMDAWHFNRDLSEVRKTPALVAQSSSMMYMSPQDSEWNRIFQVTDGYEDKFYLTIGFNINAQRPMKSLTQTADLGDGNKVIERNGNTVQ